MSARSWFSINTTTNWSKLPVASGDKCPGLAIVTGAAIGTRPDPSSATTTRRIAVRRAPAVTATDQDEAHGGEDHDEQGEGPRDPEGEIREGQGGGLDVKRSRGGRFASRVVDRLHPDLVGTVGQVEGGARCGADG